MKTKINYFLNLNTFVAGIKAVVSSIKNKVIFFRKNQNGQGLTEYLILVALLAVSSIGVVRLLNKNINAQFSNIIYAISGEKRKVSVTTTIKRDYYKQKDMTNFFDQAASENEDNEK